MKISRQRGKERPSVQDQASPSHERMDPELSRKDISAERDGMNPNKESTWTHLLPY
jgi:hypothetical protein